jgi:hypothetical protein
VQGYIQDVSPELIAEQLKTPLMHISHLIELADSRRDERIAAIASRALRTIDAYELAHNQTLFDLQPVSVGLVMYDAAHQLHSYAQQYGYEIVIDSRGRQGLVMAHARALQLLLELIGEVMIALPGTHKTQRIVLGAHLHRGEVIAGVFRPEARLVLAPRQAHGKSSDASQLDGSLAVAEALAVGLRSTLKSYRHNRLPGIGLPFGRSNQLSLI